MEINYSELVTAIVTGKLDSHLPELASLIRDRRDVAAKKLAFTIKVGDVVTLCNIRPAHLNGQRAKVTQVNRTTVTVKFEKDADKAFAAASRVPLACCQLVTN